MNDRPWVVVRCRNDMPLVAETLEALGTQMVTPRILFADNASTDGSREAGFALAAEVMDVAEGAYNPGRVLNDAMERTDGEFVVFFNSDCTPTHDTWLENLLAGFVDERIAAVQNRYPVLGRY